MKIGILQSAGIAGNIIDVALGHPEHSDIFEPVIYSKENQNERNVGADLKFGNISAIVVAPGAATELKFSGAITVFADDHIRVASIMEGRGEDTDSLTADDVAMTLRKLWRTIKRDFCVSLPRIAVLSAGEGHNDTDDIVRNTISDLCEESIYAYGPYDMETYIQEMYHQHFDITVCLTDSQTKRVLSEISEETYSRFLAGIPIVVVQTAYSANYEFDESDLDDPAQALRQAIYTAIDVVQNREGYDEAHADPLQKLYHERRDDSEKVRFAVNRKPEQAQQQQ